MSDSVKRFLVTVWHLWGFWTVVLIAAALVRGGDLKLMILGVGAGVLWPLGLIRAIYRREPTVLFRIASLGVLALALFLASALTASDLDIAFFWLRQVPLALLAGMLGIGALGLPCAGAIWAIGRRRERTARLQAWKRQIIGFPIAVFVTLLLTQFRQWLAGPAVILWALIWLWFFLRDIHDGKPVLTRLAGLGLTMVVLAAWPPVSLASNRDDIAEAVFRYQLSGGSSRNHYLEIDGHDPSGDFMKRFTDSPLRIRAASAAQAPSWEEGRNSVTDKETGESGVILYVGHIERSWINPCAVAVKGGYCSGTLAASGNTYWVVWLGTRWVVVDDVLHWVS